MQISCQLGYSSVATASGRHHEPYLPAASYVASASAVSSTSAENNVTLKRGHRYPHCIGRAGFNKVVRLFRGILTAVKSRPDHRPPQAIGRVAVLLIIALVLAAPPPSRAAGSPKVGDRDLVISDEILVELRSFPVRALDYGGRPIPGLGTDDFEVLLGGEAIPLVAADWVPAGGYEPSSRLDLSPQPPAPLTPQEEIHGNTIVFFIQADLNAVRIKGHLRTLPFVREFLDALKPQDWVAVVSFDSHLKLWHDFSRDRRSVGDAVERAVRFGNKPIPPIPGTRALANSFPVAEAKRAARPERALHLTARALLSIPGEKIIVYLGWGMGRRLGSGFGMEAKQVSITPEYGRALATLRAARASVFVLDVTYAAHHTLELGIRRVASDTGGTYSKTVNFTHGKISGLTEAISGYYLLTVDRNSLPEERRKLRVRLKGHPGEVLVVRDSALHR